MPKKKGDKNITNPLRQGVPSKVYLLAYGGKLHKYRIKQIIKYGWDSKGKRVNSNDIHRIINKYPDYFYQDKENKRVNERGQEIIPIKTYVEPIVGEMETELKEKFNHDTKLKLYDFFDSQKFRNYIFDYAKDQSIKDYLNKAVDSFESIMIMTAPITTYAYYLKKTLEKRNISTERFKKEWNENISKLIMKYLPIDNIFNEISTFLSEDTRKKMPTEKDISNFSTVIDIVHSSIDYDFSVLEKINKIGYYTYETRMIVDIGFLIIPVIVDQVKQRIKNHQD